MSQLTTSFGTWIDPKIPKNYTKNFTSVHGGEVKQLHSMVYPTYLDHHGRIGFESEPNPTQCKVVWIGGL